MRAFNFFKNKARFKTQLKYPKETEINPMGNNASNHF